MDASEFEHLGEAGMKLTDEKRWKEIDNKKKSGKYWIEYTVEPGGDLWKTVRYGKDLSRLGASGAGNAAGFGGFGTPYAYYVARTRDLEERLTMQPNEAMLRGQLFEDKCGEAAEKWIKENIKVDVKLGHTTYHIPRSKTNPNFNEARDAFRFGVSIDFTEVDEDNNELEGGVDVECKVPSNWFSWRNNYTNKMRPSIITQTMLQMAVRNKPFTYIASTVFHRKTDELIAFSMTRVDFDKDFWNWLLPRLRRMSDAIRDYHQDPSKFMTHEEFIRETKLTDIKQSHPDLYNEILTSLTKDKIKLISSQNLSPIQFGIDRKDPDWAKISERKERIRNQRQTPVTGKRALDIARASYADYLQKKKMRRPLAIIGDEDEDEEKKKKEEKRRIVFLVRKGFAPTEIDIVNRAVDDEFDKL